MMAPPTQEQIDKAARLAEQVVQLLPGRFNRIWLTEWRGWRLIFDGDLVKTCQGYCQGCPVYTTLALGVSDCLPPVILTDLHRWVTDKDKGLYGPKPFLACKTSYEFAQGFVACLLEDPEYRTIANIKKELRLVRDSRLVWTRFREVPVIEQRKLQRCVVAGVLAVQDDPKQLFRIRRALKDMMWDGSHFPEPRSQRRGGE